METISAGGAAAAAGYNLELQQLDQMAAAAASTIFRSTARSSCPVKINETSSSSTNSDAAAADDDQAHDQENYKPLMELLTTASAPSASCRSSTSCPTATISTLLHLNVYPITLKFEEVVYKVKLEQTKSNCLGCRVRAVEKTILNGLTGLVRPGEILAMLGPSGSGKTTLLTALGGRLTGKLSGKITYNGRSFSGRIRRRTGFVAQTDVLYPHLTVFETLAFTADLRLPEKTPMAAKTEHVESVVRELGLTKCRDSIVGGGLVRGISGGERKRVSIGQEMLVNPSLLLLDEPTSGLDSTTAMRILTTIKDLARVGRTIVTTIHQPSSRLYLMFDKVVLLCEGNPIYYGEASTALDYFASIGYSSPVALNAADFLLDLANGIAPEKERKEVCLVDQGGGGGGEGDNQNMNTCPKDELGDPKSAILEALGEAYNKYISGRLKSEICRVDAGFSFNYGYSSAGKVQMPNQSIGCMNSLPDDKWFTSWWHQFNVLLKRSLKERRHESFSTLRIFQVISVATLAGLLWWRTDPSHIQDRIALLFFYSVFWGFFPLYNAVFTFPQDRAMLVKERSSSMYRLSSYFIARTAGDLPMELTLPTIFVFITYWMGGLKPDPPTFILSLLILLLAVLVAQSLGLALGALLMELKQATTLASVTTLIFLLAGGYYIQQIPPFIIWLKYLSYSYYCYKLLLSVQYGENDLYECSSAAGGGGGGGLCRVADYPSIKSVGLGNNVIHVCALLSMVVGYRLLAYTALRRFYPK